MIQLRSKKSSNCCDNDKRKWGRRRRRWRRKRSDCLLIIFCCCSFLLLLWFSFLLSLPLSLSLSSLNSQPPVYDHFSWLGHHFDSSNDLLFSFPLHFCSRSYPFFSPFPPKLSLSLFLFRAWLLHQLWFFLLEWLSFGYTFFSSSSSLLFELCIQKELLEATTTWARRENRRQKMIVTLTSSIRITPFFQSSLSLSLSLSLSRSY